MSRLTIIALVLAAACGKTTPPPTAPLPEDKPAEPVVKPDEPAKPPAEPTVEPLEITIGAPDITVKLVKAGAGKKAKLAYVAGKGGEKVPVEFAFDIGQKATTPKGPEEVISPTIVLLTDAEVSASDEKTIGYTFSLNSIDARDVANQNVGTAQAIRDQIGATTGLTIKGQVGTNGVATGTTTVRIEKGDDAGKNIVNLVQQAFPSWPALPQEALGTGAKWTATSKASLMGKLDLMQETTYELVSRKGNVTTIKGTIKVSGTDAEIQGQKITGVKGSGTVEATLTDGQLPTFKTNMTTGFTVSDAANSATIDVRVGSSMTPKVAAAAAAPDAKGAPKAEAPAKK
ncbi:MAG: hypothetical protein ACKV2T_32585 [Kofleriaceae bacterium]